MPADDLPTEADAEVIDSRPTTATAVSLNDASVRAGDLAERGLSAYVSPSTRMPSTELRTVPAPAPEPPVSRASVMTAMPEIPAEANLVSGLPPAQAASATPTATQPDPAEASAGPGAGPSIPGLDPVADAQASYSAARQRAAESMQGLSAQFALLGFSAPSADALADPAALHDYAQATINRALASPAANEEAPFGPARLSPNADRIRKNLTDLGDRAASAIRDHADALSNLRASYSDLQQLQQAQAAQQMQQGTQSQQQMQGVQARTRALEGSRIFRSTSVRPMR